MFRWRDEYSVKVKVIDEQHKNLFRIGRKLYDILNKDRSYDDISRIFDELKNYAVYHFNEEEKHMKKFDYGDYENHKKEHDFFIEKVNELWEERSSIEDYEITLEILTFVEKWIENHILKTDQRYSGFFNDKGIF